MLFFHTRARGFAQEPEEGLPPGDPGVRCHLPAHDYLYPSPLEARARRLAATATRGGEGHSSSAHLQGGRQRAPRLTRWRASPPCLLPLSCTSRGGEHRLHVEHLLVEVVLRVLRPACARGILIEVEQRGVLVLQRLGRLDGPQRN